MRGSGVSAESYSSHYSICGFHYLFRTLSINFKLSMQLAQLDATMAIYDHELLKIHDSILVFGKNPYNSHKEHGIYRLNLDSSTTEFISSSKTPSLTAFAMFSKQETLYFWGKVKGHKNCSMFQFDGVSFLEIEQKGEIPNRDTGFSYAFIANQFLLIFGGCQEGTYFRNWHIFDLESREWSQLKSPEIPYCDQSSMIWNNGIGYLCLYKTSFEYEKNQTRHENYFYQFRFGQKSQTGKLGRLHQIILQEISIPIKEMSFSMTSKFDFLTYDEKTISFIASELYSPKKGMPKCKGETENSIYPRFIRKYIYNFNLETFEWHYLQKKDKETVSFILNRQNYRTVKFNNKIYFIGGEHQSISQTKKSYNEKIQVLDLEKFYHKRMPDSKTVHERNDCYSRQQAKETLRRFEKSLKLQQSICCFCQTPFPYSQNTIKNSRIQTDYQKLFPNQRIENDFMVKISKNVKTQLSSIGVIINFFKQRSVKKLKISFLDPSNSDFTSFKHTTSELRQYLKFQGTASIPSHESLSKNHLEHNNDHPALSVYQENEDFCNLEQNNIAVLGIGSESLYVWTNQANKQTTVKYCYTSNLSAPKTDWKHSASMEYKIKVVSNRVEYSCPATRQIVFENLKQYFERPEQYEYKASKKSPVSFPSFNDNCFAEENSNSEDAFKLLKQKTKIVLYVLGVRNLKMVEFSMSSLTGGDIPPADIRIKSLFNKTASSKTNSLVSYLKHLYLPKDQIEIHINSFYGSRKVEKFDLRHSFQSLQGTRLKRVQIDASACISNSNTIPNKNKSFLEETHFSTPEDDASPPKIVQDIHLVQNSCLYEIISPLQKGKSSMKNIELDSIQAADYCQKTMSIKPLIYLYRKGRLVQTVSTRGKIVCGFVELSEGASVNLDHSRLSSNIEEEVLMGWLNEVQKSVQAFPQKVDK